jgi:hypothetical protein
LGNCAQQHGQKNAKVLDFNSKHGIAGNSHRIDDCGRHYCVVEAKTG